MAVTCYQEGLLIEKYKSPTTFLNPHICKNLAITIMSDDESRTKIARELAGAMQASKTLSDHHDRLGGGTAKWSYQQSSIALGKDVGNGGCCSSLCPAEEGVDSRIKVERTNIRISHTHKGTAIGTVTTHVANFNRPAAFPGGHNMDNLGAPDRYPTSTAPQHDYKPTVPGGAFNNAGYI